MTPEITAQAKGLFAGASDAVRNQKEDVQYDSKDPLYKFGFGLSYTTFKYSDLKITKPQIAPNEETTVTVNVTNTGRVRGDEVAQMYIRDEVSSVTRPVKELKDFARITLAPGETRQVSFNITPEKLQFYNREMKRVVELGRFQIMVGGNSESLTSQTLEVIGK